MRRNLTKQAERTMVEIKRDLKAFRKRQELIRNEINDCKSWNDHIEELKDAMTRRLGPTLSDAADNKYSSPWMDILVRKKNTASVQCCYRSPKRMQKTVKGQSK